MTTKPAEQAFAGLQRYLDQAPELVRADAHRRYHELMDQTPRALVEADFPSSLLSLSQLGVPNETHHSLLLAALLDPGRSGPLARWMWPKLMERIRVAVETADPNGPNPPPRKAGTALDAWDHLLNDDPELLRYMTVEPTEHNHEFKDLDVFARAKRGGEYLFGLVVENKVKPGTDEQPDQLLRYWRMIGESLDRDYARTVFIFLTEAPRKMKTAKAKTAKGESAGDEDSTLYWVNLVWQDIADLLITASNDTDLSLGYRLQAAHHADLIDEHILHRPSQGQARARLRRLRHDAGRLSEGDPAWAQHHSTIVDIWTSYRGSHER